MKLEDLEIYRLAMELGEEVWAIVAKWDFFVKDTLGKQWIRAADSVGLNISEKYIQRLSHILLYCKRLII